MSVSHKGRNRPPFCQKLAPNEDTDMLGRGRGGVCARALFSSLRHISSFEEMSGVFLLPDFRFQGCTGHSWTLGQTLDALCFACLFGVIGAL